MHETPTPMALYHAHIAELKKRYATTLEASGLSALVIASGEPHGVFMDDQHFAFKPNPYLLQWGPLTEHPGSVLLVTLEADPQWLVYSPEDYWHQVPEIPHALADGPLKVITVGSSAELARRIDHLPAERALLGEADHIANTWGIENINPPELVAALNEYRTRKTAWEVDNMRQASDMGVRGHLAAERCFLAGGAEYDIHLAFRSACRSTDSEMPYPAIVALNENAATLHYQRLDRVAERHGSLLIDAGAEHRGYASDITRTYSEDAEFGALIEAMHEIQRALCEAAGPGVDYVELHHAAHRGIAGLLHDAGLLKVSAETAVDAGILRFFFPHGLGHFLGLQVHDVGALYKRRAATEAAGKEEDKHLRLTRVLQPGNVLTIEPGLYFIPSLLEQLRGSKHAKYLDWGRVDELRPFGGIRIEDNIHITPTGHENLTRNAFAHQQQREEHAS